MRLLRQSRASRCGHAGRWAAVVSLACLLVPACTPTQYADQADRTAYGLIGEKQLIALGQQSPFTIDYRPVPAGAAAKPAKMLLAGEPIPIGTGTPRGLTLNECLLVAARNSRGFQAEKEDLYIEALALGNMRNDWSLVDGALTAEGERVGNVGRNTSTWASEGAAELSFVQQLATGGALSLAMGLDFATAFMNIRDTTFGSMIEANFTQPLLRGAWRGFAYEDLYRAERDLAIAVLSYRRSTQTFAVGIATEYYQVLQQRDRLGIEQQSLRNFEQTYKFVKAQVEGGMLSRVQADQAEQNVLAARSRVEAARQTYEDRLDAFKLTLGIPIAANVELDQDEFTRLKPLAIPHDLATSERTALRTRPDVLTRYAALRDRKRDVEIAADAFNPQLDVMLAASVTGREPRQPFKLQTHHPTYTAGFDFSYPLNQVDNRDAYRNAVINQQRARRDLDEFLDTVRQEVRTAYRSLLAGRRNHQIQTAAVELAVRRLKLVRVEQKEGLASTRDVLEAEDDWRNSRNALTAALVNYVTTRLRFLATLGMISVDGQGRFHERQQPEYIDRFRGDAPAPGQ